MTIDCRSRKGGCLRSPVDDRQSFVTVKKSWLATVAIAVLAVCGIISTSQVLSKTANRSIANPRVNGVYLYGESSQPNVVGKEYIIFETNRQKTIGAFYLPRSEFNCFYGQFKGADLKVTLINPFTRQRSNFTLALDRNNDLNASNRPVLDKPAYQLLRKVSTNDRRILAACKQQLRNRK
jgi:hypothetical protein